MDLVNSYLVGLREETYPEEADQNLPSLLSGIPRDQLLLVASAKSCRASLNLM